MAAIILPRKWQRQPDRPVQLRSNIPQPAYCLIPVLADTYYDAVSNAIYVAGSAQAVISAGSYGLGAYPKNGSVSASLSFGAASSDVDSAPVSLVAALQSPVIGLSTGKYQSITPAYNTYPPLSIQAGEGGTLRTRVGGSNVIKDGSVLELEPGTQRGVAIRVNKQVAQQQGFIDGKLNLSLTQGAGSYWPTTESSMDYYAGGAPERDAYRILMIAFWPTTDIGDALAERLSAEPWSMLEPRREILFFSGTTSGISGSLAVTETGADTTSISGDVIVAGSLAAAETGADTAAFTGSSSSTISGNLAAAETGADTTSLTGDVFVSGTLAVTEPGNDTASIAGDVFVSGSLSATEVGSDAANFTAGSQITGTLAATESGSDTAALSGDVFVAGSLAATEVGSDSAAFSGDVFVLGTLASTEIGADTAAFNTIIIQPAAIAAAPYNPRIAAAPYNPRIAAAPYNPRIKPRALQ